MQSNFVTSVSTVKTDNTIRTLNQVSLYFRCSSVGNGIIQFALAITILTLSNCSPGGRVYLLFSSKPDAAMIVYSTRWTVLSLLKSSYKIVLLWIFRSDTAGNDHSSELFCRETRPAKVLQSCFKNWSNWQSTTNQLLYEISITHSLLSFEDALHEWILPSIYLELHLIKNALMSDALLFVRVQTAFCIWPQ